MYDNCNCIVPYTDESISEVKTSLPKKITMCKGAKNTFFHYFLFFIINLKVKGVLGLTLNSRGPKCVYVKVKGAKNTFSVPKPVTQLVTLGQSSRAIRVRRSSFPCD